MINIIEVQGISKSYHIGARQPYITLRDSFVDLFKQTKRQQQKDFWALKNISFSVKQGELLGVIGSNGAGKSTLLKILSRITSPTSGRVIVRGRVASLLEVGTGFSAELSGRENIFLNGAILGMSQKEIRKKFDQIVNFAEVEKFIDTPVKHYSSGMYMRLAFSVAAHLEPDILLIDEVLAVGDAEFQKKCLLKMEEITNNEGRTVIFVSHNLISVQKLCKNSLLLNKGKLQQIGLTKKVIDTYLDVKADSKSNIADFIFLNRPGNLGNIRFTSVKISNTNNSSFILSTDKLKISLGYTSDFKKEILDVRIVIVIISESSGKNVLNFDSDVPSASINQKLSPEGEIICETDIINLIHGKYRLDIYFHIQGTRVDYVTNAASFEVESSFKKYKFNIPPDSTVAEHIIKYSFKGKK